MSRLPAKLFLLAQEESGVQIGTQAEAVEIPSPSCGPKE